MVKKRLSIILLITAFIIASVLILAHEGEEDEFNVEPSARYPLTQLQAVSYGSIIFFILIVIILLFRKKLNERAKKAFYLLILLNTLIVTLYLISTTLHLNITSETQGPVHWHADYEVWICDEEFKLPEPQGFSNKQGTELFHSHNDN